MTLTQGIRINTKNNNFIHLNYFILYRMVGHRNGGIEWIMKGLIKPAPLEYTDKNN